MVLDGTDRTDKQRPKLHPSGGKNEPSYPNIIDKKVRRFYLNRPVYILFLVLSWDDRQNPLVDFCNIIKLLHIVGWIALMLTLNMLGILYTTQSYPISVLLTCRILFTVWILISRAGLRSQLFRIHTFFKTERITWISMVSK